MYIYAVTESDMHKDDTLWFHWVVSECFLSHDLYQGKTFYDFKVIMFFCFSAIAWMLYIYIFLSFLSI